jgi:ABC-type dipeptide/oligopeptide/nickel transport system permease component
LPGGATRAAGLRPMLHYILKRLLMMIPTLFGVAVLIFVLLRVVPGDVVEARYMAQGSQFQSQDLMNLERKKLGLDQPLWKQFTSWMGGVLRLDFGVSMWTGSPITEEIKLRFALSLQLAVMATVVATLLALPLGILAAIKQDTWIQGTCMELFRIRMTPRVPVVTAPLHWNHNDSQALSPECAAPTRRQSEKPAVTHPHGPMHAAV